MAITGYVTGIPVFCDSGFVILSPISRALASQSNVSLAVMATALSGGLYATHCLVPPTPGPIAMAGTLEADLGLTILVGLLVSIPATLSALIYAKKVSSKIDIPANPEYTVDELLQKYGKLPGALHSFSPILLPIVLIALKSVGDFPSAPFGDGVVKMFFSFIGNPVIALILGVFLAMTLVPAAEKKKYLVLDYRRCHQFRRHPGHHRRRRRIWSHSSETSYCRCPERFPSGPWRRRIPSLHHCGPVKDSHGCFHRGHDYHLRYDCPADACPGIHLPAGKVLVIMAIGAGSMTVSHANDSYFWVVSQFSDMETKDAYKCQTGMTGVMGIVTIIVVFLLSLVFVH